MNAAKRQTELGHRSLTNHGRVTPWEFPPQSPTAKANANAVESDRAEHGNVFPYPATRALVIPKGDDHGNVVSPTLSLAPASPKGGDDGNVVSPIYSPSTTSQSTNYGWNGTAGPSSQRNATTSQLQ